MDESLLFIILVIVFLLFIIQKYPRIVVVVILVYVGYMLYRARFTTPREMLEYFRNKVMEPFEPCSINNMGYCGNETGSNMTILPDILRSGPVGNNTINKPGKVGLNWEDYRIDRRLKYGVREITLDEIFQVVPILQDYKLFLERVIKYTLAIKTDDPIQKDYLARKLRYKMTAIFYNSYNTVSDREYPIQTFNELVLAEREFADTMNIFIFLGLDEVDNAKLLDLLAEFKTMNVKLNEFVRQKVNEIDANDYNITTSRIPEGNEPLAANIGLDMY